MISMDFITRIPNKINKHDAIMVVMEKLSNEARLIPIKSSFKVLEQGQTQCSMLQQCNNKTLTTDPFGNTCEEDEGSPEVEARVDTRFRCLQP
jgi:hypothetical protein